MKSYQDQKSLILSFYDELEAANADSVGKSSVSLQTQTFNGMVSIRLTNRTAEMR